MSESFSIENGGGFPTDVDLDQIFIGRDQQLSLFEKYLDRWRQEMLKTTREQNRMIPSPNNQITSLFVLLYGRSGFGKSTLLKHYRGMALQDSQKLEVINIDWEFAVGNRRGLFNPAPDQDVDAPEYFRFLCGQLADAIKKRPDEFREYQVAVRDVEEARKQANSVLDGIQKNEGFGSLRLLAGPGAITLLRWVAPRVGQALDSAQVTSKVEEVIGQGAQIGAQQLVHAYLKVRDRLGHKLDDYLEPGLKLGLSLGRDLGRMARNFPLLIFFDTYEEVDEADNLLRLVMEGAGIRVGWVLAGRDNLWAGLEQRKRSVGKVYGYKDIVSPGLGLAIDFNIGGVGAFTASDIVEYFSLLREKAPGELTLPVVTEEDAGRILEVTQGVPLAIRIAAGLYLEQTDLAIITEKPESRREIVDVMVERYLLHTRDDQDERARLYGLAMLRRADHPPAIAAALGLSSEQARMRYEAELSRLQRRYSFIFAEKMQPSLHQEVRHFLRLWLREHCSEPPVQAVNELLVKAHETALSEREEHWHYNTVRERLEDEEWVGIYLDLIEQQFWLDAAKGVRYSLPFMLAASIYQRNINQEVASIGQFFIKNIVPPYRKWWQWATSCLINGPIRTSIDETLDGLEKLTQVVSQRHRSFMPPLPDCSSELEALLWWRLGEAYQSKNSQKALGWYRQALTRLHDAELKDVTAETYYDMASQLLDAKMFAESIPLLNQAIELNSDLTPAYINRSNAHLNLGAYDSVIEDCNLAIASDRNFAPAYSNRGAAYRVLQQYKEALEDYNRAIVLDPNYTSAYINRGNAYYDLQQYQRAIEDYDRAIALDPSYALPYENREIAYLSAQSPLYRLQWFFSDQPELLTIVTSGDVTSQKLRSAYQQSTNLFRTQTNLYVVGRTGTGKTSIGNMLFGQEIMEKTDLINSTQYIGFFQLKSNLCYIDTPGAVGDEYFENITRVVLDLDQIEDYPITTFTTINFTNAKRIGDYTQGAESLEVTLQEWAAEYKQKFLPDAILYVVAPHKQIVRGDKEFLRVLLRKYPNKIVVVLNIWVKDGKQVTTTANIEDTKKRINDIYNELNLVPSIAPHFVEINALTGAGLNDVTTQICRIISPEKLGTIYSVQKELQNIIAEEELSRYFQSKLHCIVARLALTRIDQKVGQQNLLYVAATGVAQFTLKTFHRSAVDATSSNELDTIIKQEIEVIKKKLSERVLSQEVQIRPREIERIPIVQSLEKTAIEKVRVVRKIQESSPKDSIARVRGPFNREIGDLWKTLWGQNKKAQESIGQRMEKEAQSKISKEIIHEFDIPITQTELKQVGYQANNAITINEAISVTAQSEDEIVREGGLTVLVFLLGLGLGIKQCLNMYESSDLHTTIKQAQQQILIQLNPFKDQLEHFMQDRSTAEQKIITFLNTELLSRQSK